MGSMNKVYIPLILRSKILEENKKYLFPIVILNMSVWIFCGIKANCVDFLIHDFGLFFYLFGIIYTFLAAKLIIEHFSKVFNIDLYNSALITETSKEFKKIEKILGEKTTKYQNEILNLICNKNEKKFITIGLFIIISAIILYWIHTKTFGTMYDLVLVYPWTYIATVANFIFWFFFIAPLLLSLFWELIGMLRGFKLMGNYIDLMLTSGVEDEKVSYNLISLKHFVFNIKPIIDLIFLISSLAIIFSFLYTVAVVCTSVLLPMPALYFLSLLVILGGLSLFLWPQITLHNVLENVRESTLLEYYNPYENKRLKYLNILKEPNVDFEVKEDTRKDFSLITDTITQIENFNTWPYFSRMYKLIGVSLSSIIIILVQIISNKFM